MPSCHIEFRGLEPMIIQTKKEKNSKTNNLHEELEKNIENIEKQIQQLKKNLKLSKQIFKKIKK